MDKIDEITNELRTNIIDFKTRGYEVDRIESDLETNTVHIYYKPIIESITVDFTIYPTTVKPTIIN